MTRWLMMIATVLVSCGADEAPQCAQFPDGEYTIEGTLAQTEPNLSSCGPTLNTNVLLSNDALTFSTFGGCVSTGVTRDSECTHDATQDCDSGNPWHITTHLTRDGTGDIAGEATIMGVDANDEPWCSTTYDVVLTPK